MSLRTLPALALMVFLAAMLAGEPRARAGGGPADVLVIYNQADAVSVNMARYYRERRAIPAAHMCPLALGRGAPGWLTMADYLRRIAAPVERCIASVPQPDEIDILVVMRGVPYAAWLDAPLEVPPASAGIEQSTRPSSDEVITRRFAVPSLLQVLGARRVSDNALLAGLPVFHSRRGPHPRITNPFRVTGDGQGLDPRIHRREATASFTSTTGIRAMRELPRSFLRARARRHEGYDLADHLYLVTYVDGFSESDIRALIDRSIDSEGTFPGTADGGAPAAEVLCMEGEDSPRGSRDRECELAVRSLTSIGVRARYLRPLDPQLSGAYLASYYTGALDLTGAIAGNRYAPGALADNLTSYGAWHQNLQCERGRCPRRERQTSILRFIAAGATGAHGSADEPQPHTFPQAGTLLFYTSGYSLAESWFFTQPYLYWTNHYVGDPLTTPYDRRPEVCLNVVGGALPADLPIRAAARHARGVAEMRVYLDGRRVKVEQGSTVEARLRGVRPGQRVEVLVVAVAHNAVVERPGWPVQRQHIRNDVQGWTARQVTIGPPGGADRPAPCQGTAPVPQPTL